MKKLTIVLMSLCFSIQFFAQQKFEKEYRVKEADVPKIASDFTNAINFKKRLKWYAEESNDGKTFEAKVCHNKNLYSIEFSNTGKLLDIEKKIKSRKFDTEIANKIANYLKANYTKFKIKKIQIQYKGSTQELKQVFLNDANSLKYIAGFELIVKAKKEKRNQLYEMFFSKNGSHIKTLTIVPSSSLNLEF